MGINAAWHSLISMVIIVMHRTHDRLWLTLLDGRRGQRRGLEYSGRLLVHGRKARTGQAHHIIGEPPHRAYKHAPNGSQSQDPGLTPLDLVHRFGRSGAEGWSTKGALRGGLHGFKVHRHHPHHYPIHFQL